jgi:hypothetical protein
MLDQSVALRLTSLILIWVLILSCILVGSVNKADVRTFILIFLLMFMQTWLHQHRFVNEPLLGLRICVVLIMMNIHSLRGSEVFVLIIYCIIIHI